MIAGINRVPGSSGAYRILLFSVIFLFLAALGPGWYLSEGDTAWMHYQLFDMLCHQDPERSFHFMGSLMAVCSRCIGVYGGALAGTALMPLFARWVSDQKKGSLFFFGFATLTNFTDLIGNYFGIWTNTSESRLILGFLFGTSTVLLLSRAFFTKN
jgi:uncharacterized membrane protein